MSGRQPGGQGTQTGKAPTPDNYVCFRIRRGNFRIWAELSKVAKNIHGLLCLLPCGTGDGWHGSACELRETYAEVVGRQLSGSQTMKALDELKAVELLRVGPLSRQRTNFVVVDLPVSSKTGRESLHREGAEPTRPIGGDHTRDRVGSPPASLLSVERSCVETEGIETTAVEAPRPPTPTPVPTTASEHDSLFAAAAETFDGQVSEHTLLALVAELGAEAIADQLRWFRCRDVTGFRRGPAAAFVHFCRTRAPEPDSERVRRQAAKAPESQESYEARCEAAAARWAAVRNEERLKARKAEERAEEEWLARHGGMLRQAQKARSEKGSSEELRLVKPRPAIEQAPKRPYAEQLSEFEIANRKQLLKAQLEALMGGHCQAGATSQPSGELRPVTGAEVAQQGLARTPWSSL